MAESRTIIVHGKQLKCPFCGNDQFFEFSVRLNTIHTTFFSGVLALAAKKGKAYVCSKCGFVQEFMGI